MRLPRPAQSRLKLVAARSSSDRALCERATSKGATEAHLGAIRVGLGQPQEQGTAQAMDLRLPVALARLVHPREGLGEQREAGVHLPRHGARLRQQAPEARRVDPAAGRPPGSQPPLHLGQPRLEIPFLDESPGSEDRHVREPQRRHRLFGQEVDLLLCAPPGGLRVPSILVNERREEQGKAQTGRMRDGVGSAHLPPALPRLPPPYSPASRWTTRWSTWRRRRWWRPWSAATSMRAYTST